MYERHGRLILLTFLFQPTREEERKKKKRKKEKDEQVLVFSPLFVLFSVLFSLSHVLPL